MAAPPAAAGALVYLGRKSDPRLWLTRACGRRPQTVLRGLHVVMAVTAAALGALCCVVHARGGEAEGVAVGAMLLLMSLLGATLMGMLPFCLQQAAR